MVLVPAPQPHPDARRGVGRQRGQRVEVGAQRLVVALLAGLVADPLVKRHLPRLGNGPGRGDGENLPRQLVHRHVRGVELSNNHVGAQRLVVHQHQRGGMAGTPVHREKPPHLGPVAPPGRGDVALGKRRHPPVREDGPLWRDRPALKPLVALGLGHRRDPAIPAANEPPVDPRADALVGAAALQGPLRPPLEQRRSAHDHDGRPAAVAHATPRHVGHLGAGERRGLVDEAPARVDALQRVAGDGDRSRAVVAHDPHPRAKRREPVRRLLALVRRLELPPQRHEHRLSQRAEGLGRLRSAGVDDHPVFSRAVAGQRVHGQRDGVRLAAAPPAHRRDGRGSRRQVPE